MTAFRKGTDRRHPRLATKDLPEDTLRAADERAREATETARAKAEAAARRPAAAPVERDDDRAPRSCYFPSHVERRRRLFYAEMAQAGELSGWRTERGDHAAPKLAPGREGKRLDLDARVRVNEDPRHPDEWAPFDTSHPIEKMRLKGTLGRDGAETGRRYKAARVWFMFFERANGLSSPGGWLREFVDGSGDPQAGPNDRMQASIDRLSISEAPGMTWKRFQDLDAVCGMGRGWREQGRATRRDYKTVQESVLSGLDVVASYEPWQRKIEYAPILRLQDVRRKA